MKIDLEYIKQIVKNPEGVEVEFKETTGQLRRAMETLCGMLNGNGGLVIFGISDKGKIIGQEVTDKTTREIGEALRKFEPSVNIQPVYIPLDKSNKKLIVFSSEATPNKPYVWDGKPYQRFDSVTSVMPLEHLLKLSEANRGFRYNWETEDNPEIKIENIDEKLVRGIVRLGINNGRLSADAEMDDLSTILHRLGLIKDGVLNNAAAILFGKDINITTYPQCMIRMARFKGKDKAVFIDNQQVRGNIFELMNAAISFFFKHLNLHGTTHNRLDRQDELEVPYNALRECVTNALCHRAWQYETHSIGIAIYDDRIEVENAGRFPWNISPNRLTEDEEKHEANTSNPPNKIIANVLYLAGKIEHWGRGLSMMRNECQRIGMPAPQIRENGSFVYVSFQRLPQGLSLFDLSFTEKGTSKNTVEYGNDTSRVQVKDKVGQSKDTVGQVEGTSRVQVEGTSRVQVKRLNEKHLRLIKLIGEDWLNASELRSRMGFKTRNAFVRNYISPLYERGILVLQQPESPRSPTQRYGLSVKGKAIFYTGDFNVINSIMYGTSNTPNATSNSTSNATSNAISKHIGKLSYIDLCMFIVNVSDTWKTAQEIAQAVMRSVQHIRSNILPRMVKDGYLEMLATENPNSPFQKYRATTKGKQLL